MNLVYGDGLIVQLEGGSVYQQGGRGLIMHSRNKIIECHSQRDTLFLLSELLEIYKFEGSQREDFQSNLGEVVCCKYLSREGILVAHNSSSFFILNPLENSIKNFQHT